MPRRSPLGGSACTDMPRYLTPGATHPRASRSSCQSVAMRSDEPARDGPSFYDDENVFDRYTRARASAESANETLEGPDLDDLVGDPDGLRILELGCGSGAYGRKLLDTGATRYVGIDASKRMIAAARAVLDGTRAE